MRVWLDDVRTPPSFKEWVWLTTGEQLLALIDEVGLESIETISLDNDLGTGTIDGYQVLDVIERAVLTGQVTKVPELYVHSRNPVAAERMRIVIERIKTYVAQLSLL